jgi:uncharacterized membrane protein
VNTSAQRVVALEEQVEQLRRRVGELEEFVGVARPRRQASVSPPLPPKPSLAETEAAPPPAVTAEADQPPFAPFEDLLGGRILAWLGGAAVVLGVVFFLVMAVSRGWIDESTRVVLAFAGSTVLLLAGLWLYERKGRLQAAVATVAAAIAALYASLTAATALYELVPVPAGLLLAALFGGAATSIAVRWSAPVVAGIGIVGALLSPVLVGADANATSIGFVALALTAAVGVLLWRRWDWLALISFAVTLPQLAAWAYQYDAPLALVLPAVAVFWFLYGAAAIGYELRVPTKALRASSALLLFAAAAAAGWIGWDVLDDGHGDAATAWVVGLAAAHIVAGAAGLRTRASREIASLVVAIGLALSAVGFALALSGPALVAGWAAEGALLAWFARRYGDRRAVVGAVAFLALALGHVLLFEAPLRGLVDGVDDLLVTAVALSIVALAFFASASQLRALLPEPATALTALTVALEIYLVSLAIVDAWGVSDLGVQQQAGQLGLSVFWSLTGLAGIVIGLVRGDRRFRYGGLALLALAVVKVFAYDLAELESIYRVVSFVGLGLLLLAGAFAYQRLRAAHGGPAR